MLEKSHLVILVKSKNRNVQEDQKLGRNPVIGEKMKRLTFSYLAWWGKLAQDFINKNQEVQMSSSTQRPAGVLKTTTELCVHRVCQGLKVMINTIVKSVAPPGRIFFKFLALLQLLRLLYPCLLRVQLQPRQNLQFMEFL